MRFATYGRKSVYSDKSDSVDNQERMCREYVELRFQGKIDSFESYSDEGMTGANTNRPGLKRLLADVEDGLVDALIVYQLDRLSRNVKDFSNIYSALEEKGVMFISLRESIDTNTPIGKAMMFITATFAQMERETIATRVKDNMLGLAKKGLWAGGKPPYGYTRKEIELEGKKHVTIEIDPDASEYDKWIFDTFLEKKYSLHAMETEFKKKGIRTVNGAFFSTTQLYKILTMPYCVEATPEVYDHYASMGCIIDPGSPREKWDGTHGVMVYGRTKGGKGIKHTKQQPDKWIVCLGYHKPFIPAEKWLAVQERFRKNMFDKTMKYDIPLLKGVLRCAKCGRLMSVSRKKITNGITSHYYCVKRVREGVDACDMRAIKCDILDKKALSIFREIESDPKAIMKHVETTQPMDDGKYLRDLEAQATKLQLKIGRLAESLEDTEGSAAAKYIIAQIEKNDLNLEAIRREIELAKLNVRKDQKIINTAEGRASEIARLIRGLDVFTATESNDIVKDVVQKCTWDGESLFLNF